MLKAAPPAPTCGCSQGDSCRRQPFAGSQYPQNKTMRVATTGAGSRCCLRAAHQKPATQHHCNSNQRPDPRAAPLPKKLWAQRTTKRQVQSQLHYWGVRTVQCSRCSQSAVSAQEPGARASRHAAVRCANARPNTAAVAPAAGAAAWMAAAAAVPAAPPHTATAAVACAHTHTRAHNRAPHFLVLTFSRFFSASICALKIRP